ncbi:MAG: hypothetical protein CMM60_14280 [Rhodospirillaceae bacterium]|nr:hypothetical protein [Rhodospirillaceae bacterium]
MGLIQFRPLKAIGVDSGNSFSFTARVVDVGLQDTSAEIAAGLFFLGHKFFLGRLIARTQYPMVNSMGRRHFIRIEVETPLNEPGENRIATYHLAVGENNPRSSLEKPGDGDEKQNACRYLHGQPKFLCRHRLFGG